MSTRVLSTPEAKQAAQQMQAILNGGLAEQIQSLQTQGQTLSEPNIWDGPLAAQFRGEWPQVMQACNNMRQQINTLAQQVQRIVQDITTAGGG